jgi:hypothetical protein
MSWRVAMIALCAACLPPIPMDGTVETDEAAVIDTEVVEGDATPADDTEEVDAASLVGAWFSQGEDVAPLLAGPPFGVVRIDAMFRANGSYSVTSRDGEGNSVDFEGSYTLDRSTSPHGIALEQTAPVAGQARGIWAITGSTLRYDVVDTSLGTPATAGSGFGSSSAGEANVQRYQRVP